MKNSSRFFIGFGLLVQLACFGCAGSFDAEMNEAQQAMDQAKSFHADELAPSDWKEAQESYDRAQAAAKAGKPAKNLFINAKARFKKAGTIAKSYGETIAKEISDIQLAMGEKLSKIKAALLTGNPGSKSRNQVNSIVAEAETGTESISKMVAEGDYLKGRTLAREIRKKLYDAELILAGKKPVS